MNSVIAGVIAVYALWVFYLAVMNLRRAKEAGKLSKMVLVIALPVLVTAYVIDVLVNVSLATILFVDLPREWTFSHRLERYSTGDDWRAAVALWIAVHMLDPFDPSGSHLRR